MHHLLVGKCIRQVEPSAPVQSALERDGRGGEVMEEDCSETVRGLIWLPTRIADIFNCDGADIAMRDYSMYLK